MKSKNKGSDMENDNFKWVMPFAWGGLVYAGVFLIYPNTLAAFVVGASVCIGKLNDLWGEREKAKEEPTGG